MKDRKGVHYHTVDHVNGARYVHLSLKDLKWYLRGTGEEMMSISECVNPACLEEEED